MPHTCAPRVPPCCEAAICVSAGAFCQDLSGGGAAIKVLLWFWLIEHDPTTTRDFCQWLRDAARCQFTRSFVFFASFVFDPSPMGHAMDPRTASLVALGVVLLVSAAPSGTNAQQAKKNSAGVWGEAVDLTPLVIPPVRPFLTPISVLVPGSASG